MVDNIGTEARTRSKGRVSGDRGIKIFFAFALSVVFASIFAFHSIIFPNHDVVTDELNELMIHVNHFSSPASSSSALGSSGNSVDVEDKQKEPSSQEEVKYHIVFSTGCAHQDWQSYLMFYHLWKSGQKGDATRVASGCSAEEEEYLKKVHAEQIDKMSPGNFHIHFTPDYSHVVPGGNYHFFNKAFGIRHWMEHGLKYSENAHLYDKDMFVILDPDQIVVRPFTHDFTNEKVIWNIPKTKKQQFIVQEGVPFGQEYGLPVEYLPTVDMVKAGATKDELPSHANTLTIPQAQDGYRLGPPYIAIGKDFFKLVIKWTEFAPGVFYVRPGHITEMHAYIIAAAHLNLSHQLAHSFMLSVYDDPRLEAWPLFIDEISDTQVCEKPTEGRTLIQPNFDLPQTIHFCHRYMLGKWFYNKYFVPKDFMSCESPLMAEPPQNVSLLFDFGITRDKRTEVYKKPGLTKRIAFMMCQMIYAMNEAATHNKKNHCDPNTVNMNKTFIFHDSMYIEPDYLDRVVN